MTFRLVFAVLSVALVAASAEAQDAVPSAADHLRRAAGHWEAAGLPEEAAEIRRRADRQDARERLQEKFAELARLQAEIEELQVLVREPQPVQVSARLLEASPETRQVLCGRASGDGRSDTAEKPDATPSGASALTIKDAERLSKCVRILASEQRLRVLCEPELVTAIGRPANVFAGSEIPIPVGPDADDIEWRPVGTRIDATPVALANGNLRLDVRVENCEQDAGHTARFHGREIPGLITRCLNASVELAPGETAVVCGPQIRQAQAEDPADEVGPGSKELILVISADFAAQAPTEFIEDRPAIDARDGR